MNKLTTKKSHLNEKQKKKKNLELIMRNLHIHMMHVCCMFIFVVLGVNESVDMFRVRVGKKQLSFQLLAETSTFALK